jgi:hypothetical protein
MMEAESDRRPFVFVIMPFSADFDDIYETVRTSLEGDLGVIVARADTIPYYTTTIYQQLVDAIDRADVMVADLTGSNANVFYELGFAHAKAKIVVPVSADEPRELPFDVAGFRTLFYKRSSLHKTLGMSLVPLVREALRLVRSGAGLPMPSLGQSVKEIIAVKVYAVTQARTAGWNRAKAHFGREQLTKALHLPEERVYSILDTLRGQSLLVCFNWKDSAVWMATPNLEKDPDLPGR